MICIKSSTQQLTSDAKMNNDSKKVNWFFLKKICKGKSLQGHRSQIQISATSEYCPKKFSDIYKRYSGSHQKRSKELLTHMLPVEHFRLRNHPVSVERTVSKSFQH